MAKNMAAMLKEAQKFQAKMVKVQEELEAKRVEGTAGGGMVTVVANGKQEIIEIKIDPEVIDPEDKEILEDLILAAVRQASERSKKLAEEEMSRLAGGILPGLSIPGL